MSPHTETAGNKITSVTFGCQGYNVWKTADSKYFALVPTSVMTSGTLDLLAMFNWLKGQGWPATWNFTDFSVTDN